MSVAEPKKDTLGSWRRQENCPVKLKLKIEQARHEEEPGRIDRG